LNFTAYSDESGHAIPLIQEGGDWALKGGPIYLNATLETPIKMTPQLNLPPPNHNQMGCMNRSKTPQWDITDMFFERTYQMNPFLSMYRYSLRFTLTNLANNYAIPCTLEYGTPGTAMEEFPLATGWVWCSDPAANSGLALQEYRLESNVQYNNITSVLSFKQTWHCDDKSPSTP
jgi:hypothetical protein